MYGWTGKILRINLSTQNVSVEQPEPDQYRRFLGGRGLGCDILWREVSANVDPLSPENKLIFMTGPFTGTKVPTSGRFTVTAKSPLTGTVFDSNSGGIWGPRLKKAGYDGLIIEGKSERPVYISITEEGAVIKDASDLWGMDVPETTKSVKNKDGQGFSVACIGPSGENLVKLACIMNEGTRALGREVLAPLWGPRC